MRRHVQKTPRVWLDQPFDKEIGIQLAHCQFELKEMNTGWNEGRLVRLLRF